jgi:RHS repeat-associated protein
VVSPGAVTSISLKYDPAGNRIYKSSSVSVGSVARKYIVDVVGDLPVILLEINPSNGAIVKTYMYANSEILAEHDGDYTANQYFYLHDRLGSVRQVINFVGSVPSVVKLFTFNPYGQTIEDFGSFYTPWQFTGQWYDSETGQYYLRNRQYSPYLSRFTSYDPVAGNFENPLSLHKYLYCQNNPINFVDPSGREIRLGWIPAKKTPIPHTFLEIIPEDQALYMSAWLNAEYFDIDTMQVHFTIECVSDNESNPLNGYLKALLVGQPPHKSYQYRDLLLKGKNEDAVISSLLNAYTAFDENYKNGRKLTYDLFTSNPRTCNSFTSGLLEAVGLKDVNPPPSYTMGWKNPVPIEYFRND